MSGETQSIEAIETETVPVFEDTRGKARRCQLRLYKNDEGKWLLSAYVGHYVPASTYEVPLWKMLVDARREIKALKAQVRTLTKMLDRKSVPGPTA